MEEITPEIQAKIDEFLRKQKYRTGLDRRIWPFPQKHGRARLPKSSTAEQRQAIAAHNAQVNTRQVRRDKLKRALKRAAQRGLVFSARDLNG